MLLAAVSLRLIAQVPVATDAEETAELLRQFWWISAYSNLVFFVGGAFMLWMLVHCIRHDPDRGMWIWIILIMGPAFQLGAILYFFIRYLPSRETKVPALLKRWTRGRE